tara:strand:+ start:57 stop:509 length:453 start_codon:yes stop_codon:yes gene_type:complete
MNKKTFFKNAIFTMVLSFTMTFSAQTSPSDFWQSFETITAISELQENYPNASPGETIKFVLMKHGIEIPSQENYAFQSKIAVDVLDKSTILDLSISEFFIIHEAKFMENQAYFEVLFYYNFSGNYLYYKTAKVNLSKMNGNWSITNSIVE